MGEAAGPPPTDIDKTLLFLMCSSSFLLVFFIFPECSLFYRVFSYVFCVFPCFSSFVLVFRCYSLFCSSYVSVFFFVFPLFFFIFSYFYLLFIVFPYLFMVLLCFAMFGGAQRHSAAQLPSSRQRVQQRQGRATRSTASPDRQRRQPCIYTGKITKNNKK